MKQTRITGIGMTSQRTRSRLISRLSAMGIEDSRVLAVMEDIPRHLFIDEALSHRAYDDSALPIGLGQTISQPYIVAQMTALLLENNPCDKVLEIGTGSGYQTAILAKLIPQIFTIERLKPLLEQARTRLTRLRYTNVRYRHADGTLGWQEFAPYDGILVAAAPAEIPQALIDQLKEGGRLVIPVGESEQHLHVLTKQDGQLVSEKIEAVRFVPLISGAVS